MLTLPPLLDDNGKPESWFGIKFDNGLVSIEITDEGGGAYLVIETQEPWKMTINELRDFTQWAEDWVNAVDRHNNNPTT
jgi:hypothetical protein